MMRSLFLPALFLLFNSCAEKPHPEQEPAVITTPEEPATTGNAVRFYQIDDNISHDTLLIQTTFDLGDGTFLMIASNAKDEERSIAGERTAGLRLYHYQLEQDGSPKILAYSSPAYDSWTLFPVFYKDPHQQDSHILLANMGERSSWGQKVIRFNATGFRDLGFLNVAAVEQVVNEEEVTTKLVSIAPHTRLSSEGEELVFTFQVIEILLYDDLEGNLEQTLNGDRVQYRWNSQDGMLLYIDGQPRREQQTS